jgi:hypothetical protein
VVWLGCCVVALIRVSRLAKRADHTKITESTQSRAEGCGRSHSGGNEGAHTKAKGKLTLLRCYFAEKTIGKDN